MNNNAFFQMDDPSSLDILGFKIDSSWWSRSYEYPWALMFAQRGDVVADMGCGHWERPFKHALVEVGCSEVIATDRHRDVLKLKNYGPLTHVRSDFENDIGAMLPARHFDVVFCISVLEDLGEWIKLLRALEEFKRILKNDGKIVLTFDVPFDTSLPTPHYPGLLLTDFLSAKCHAGLEFVGDYSEDRDNAVFNEQFNLCVYHAVLQKVAG